MSNGPQFFQTGYGRIFFDSQLPRLLAALESIATSLATIAAVAQEKKTP